MKLRRPVILGLVLTVAPLLLAQVPQIIHFQGMVSAHDVKHNGLGLFKFSLVNSNGTVTFWSNDGTGRNGEEPAAAVEVDVVKGIFSVTLGDTILANMSPIPFTVFTNSDVRMRVWFSDKKNRFQQLEPDQRITAVGYALVAATVPSGTITADKLAPNLDVAALIRDGSITTTKLAPRAVTTAALAPGAVGTAQLADKAITAGKIAESAIGSNQLAAGTALANLLASGQSAVPSGGMVLSTSSVSTNLLAAGYVQIGQAELRQREWHAVTATGAPSPRFSHTAVWTGTEMLIWGGIGSSGSYLNTGGRFNPIYGWGAHSSMATHGCLDRKRDDHLGRFR